MSEHAHPYDIDIAPHETKGVTYGAIAAMYLIAVADGEVQLEEREIITQLVGAYKADMSPREVLQLIEESIAMFEEAGPTVGPEVFKQCRDLSLDAKLFIAHAGATLVISRQSPDALTRRTLGMIVGWLDLGPAGNERWLREFRERTAA